MPHADITSISTITDDSARYCGWSTVARRHNGELLVVCSGDREAHVCPYGKVLLLRSNDDGYSWTKPRILANGPLDDRDAGILETRKGTLLVNWFTSLAFAQPGHRYERFGKKISQATRKRELGHWMIRSTDAGRTWSKKFSSIANSPHGPMQLKDGRILFVGRRVNAPHHGGPPVPTNGVAESRDDGKTWRWIADMTQTKRHPFMYEYHAVEADDGTIVAQMRCHEKSRFHETLQTESHDGGYTWTNAHTIGVWGIPSHLMKLKDGRLLMTYGHRRDPLGNQARVSEDHGKTWSDPLILHGEANSWDLGYPSTVQLTNGMLITVWYERRMPESIARLRMARWRIVD